MSVVNHGWPRGYSGSHVLVQNLDRAVISTAGSYDLIRAWNENDCKTQLSLLGLQYFAVRSFASAKRFGGTCLMYLIPVLY